MDLGLNTKKIVTMVISKKQETPKCNIRLKDSVLQHVEKFKYLGSLITSDGRSINEIKIRIVQAKKALQDFSTISRNKHILIKMRKTVLECYIVPILTYGSESWTINNAAVNVINAAEMIFKKYAKIIVHRQNYQLMQKCSEEQRLGRKLCVIIRERQIRFCGHVMRRDGSENIITTGMINDKRSRGSQRVTHVDGLKMGLQREKHSINT